MTGYDITRGITKCLYLDLLRRDLSMLCIHFIYVKKNVLEAVLLQLRYYFPNEIKNSTHSNEGI